MLRNLRKQVIPKMLFSKAQGLMNHPKLSDFSGLIYASSAPSEKDLRRRTRRGGRTTINRKKKNKITKKKKTNKQEHLKEEKKTGPRSGVARSPQIEVVVDRNSQWKHQHKEDPWGVRLGSFAQNPFVECFLFCLFVFFCFCLFVLFLFCVKSFF